MIVAYFLVSSGIREATRLLIAWNVGAWAFLAMVAHMMSAPSADARVDSAPEDEAQGVLLTLAIVAACAAIAAIIWELGPVKDMSGALKAWHVALVVATILSAWTFIHLMFALHYAGACYTPSENGGVRGGLRFPGAREPGGEFAYQAFVIGCAFATADVNVTTTDMRRIVLAQSVLSFFFNTVVLALTINIAAGFI